MLTEILEGKPAPYGGNFRGAGTCQTHLDI